jgi:hypothetical protein
MDETKDGASPFVFVGVTLGFVSFTRFPTDIGIGKPLSG